MLKATIYDALVKAKNPKRLFFGIVEQSLPQERMVQNYNLSSDQIRYMGVNLEEARGLGWARSLAMNLYNNEDWFFQIDAHMVFDKDWDETFIRETKKCQVHNERVITGALPLEFTIKDGMPYIPHRNSNVIATVSYTGEMHADYFNQIARAETDSSVALKGFSIAGGCAFAPGYIVNELPYDPNHYFNREQPAWSIRAYTHGWDIYHIPNLPIYHIFQRTHSVSAWDDEAEKRRFCGWAEMEKRSTKRFKDMVENKPGLGIFALGNKRTLQDYANFCGVDYINMSIDPRAKEPMKETV